MNIFKQAGQSAKDAAKKAALQIKREPTEILRNIKDQVVSKENNPSTSGPSMMQEVMTGGGKVVETTAAEEQSIHAKARSRLQQIEAELRQLRMQREQKSQDWQKQQEQLMGPSESERRSQNQEVALPAKKPHGPPKPGGKKQDNTPETSRQKKG